MSKYIKRSVAWGISVISFVFMFVPEDAFKQYSFVDRASDNQNVILIRILLFVFVIVASFVINAIYQWLRVKVKINGKNYSIQVMYGNLLKQKKCKVVIPFDECFTTKVGPEVSDINPMSLCGQYLKANPDLNIQQLLSSSNICVKGKSKFAGKDRYESGRVIINGDDLLMAFAKLDKDGKGVMSRKEYLESLCVLWEEIDKYYGQMDVCIPILGSGTTRIGDELLTQQELLDIMIYSYKLSTHKIKNPCNLKIVCKRRADFSLNKICEL